MIDWKSVGIRTCSLKTHNKSHWNRCLNVLKMCVQVPVSHRHVLICNLVLINANQLKIHKSFPVLLMFPAATAALPSSVPLISWFVLHGAFTEKISIQLFFWQQPIYLSILISKTCNPPKATFECVWADDSPSSLPVSPYLVLEKRKNFQGLFFFLFLK